METEKKVERHAHVCPLCKNSHMSDFENMILCMKCIRLHNIDLGIMEMYNKGDEFVANKIKEQVKVLIEWDVEIKRKLRFNKILTYVLYSMVGLNILISIFNVLYSQSIF